MHKLIIAFVLSDAFLSAMQKEIKQPLNQSALRMSSTQLKRIIDANGQIMQLTSDQCAAAMQCEMICHLFDDLGKDEELSWHQIEHMEYLTVSNITYLFDCILVKKSLDIKKDLYLAQNLGDLYDLAKYLAAPKEVIEQFAVLVCQQLTDKDKPEIEDLYEDALYHIDAYPTCKSFFKDLKEHQQLPIADDYVPHRLELSFDKIRGIKKKLRSLKDLETIRNYLDTERISTLNIEGHEIADFDITQIKKIFPRLLTLNLNNNKIAQLKKSHVNASNIDVYLLGNQIKSIERDCFAHLKRQKKVKISLQNNPLSNQSIDLIRARHARLAPKTKTFFKYLWATKWPLSLAMGALALQTFLHIHDWNSVMQIASITQKKILLASLTTLTHLFLTVSMPVLIMLFNHNSHAGLFFFNKFLFSSTLALHLLKMGLASMMGSTYSMSARAFLFLPASIVAFISTYTVVGSSIWAFFPLRRAYRQGETDRIKIETDQGTFRIR